MEAHADRQRQLTRLVRAQESEIEAWQAAELHLLEQAYRQRLSTLGVEVTREVAVALMAAATFLGQHSPEWGGDARTSLAEVALLGLRLVEGATPSEQRVV